jgi:hypothetical protein
MALSLVPLTAVARNYDQTFILEKPFLWLFGPLMFSLFSGTWVFLVAYAIAWGYMDRERPPLWSAWPAFMGLFWMTAPIAWLYAIPVERFFDSVTAARANVCLLTIVSVWRVLLMARVFQVLHGAPFVMALFWVLIPATIEVLVLSVFGAGFSKRIMAGMMGMRNSPEDEVLLRSISIASTIALSLLPVATLGTVVWRMKRHTTTWPDRTPGRVPLLPLGIAAAFWIAVAIIPQGELFKSATLERMLAKGEFRQALDYLSTHRPDEFAPSRTLPPKPFEGEIFKYLPALFGVITPSDPVWVHEHLLRRLTEMCGHFDTAWNRPPDDTAPREERITKLNQGIEWAQRFATMGGTEFNAILDGLQKIPAGRNWLSTNQLFLAALAAHAAEAPGEAQRTDWSLVVTHLTKLGVTNSVTAK